VSFHGGLRKVGNIRIGDGTRWLNSIRKRAQARAENNGHPRADHDALPDKGCRLFCFFKNALCQSVLPRSTSILEAIKRSSVRGAFRGCVSTGRKKPQVPPLRSADNQTATARFEWVAQVSILRPGFLLANGCWPKHPGLKIETWATHLIFVRAIFTFLGGPLASAVQRYLLGIFSNREQPAVSITAAAGH